MNWLGIFALILCSILLLVFIVLIRLRLLDRSYEKSLRSRNESEFLGIEKQTSKSLKPIMNQLRKLEFFNVIINKNTIRIEVEEHHKFSIFRRIRIKKNFLGSIDINATLSKSFPDRLIIFARGYPMYHDLSKFTIGGLEKLYDFYSNDPSFWEVILNNTVSQTCLMNLGLNMKQLYITEDMIETSLVKKTDFENFAKLIISLEVKILTSHKVFEETVIEDLVCYSCGNPFDPLEEVCEECGAPRPRCIICYQKLDTLEKDIVELACCNIYAHKEHLIQWLNTRPKCPNCQKNIQKWFNEFIRFEDLKQLSI